MTSPADQIIAFSYEDRAAFDGYLLANPNTRRVTLTRKDVWLQWLTSIDGKSLTQAEHNQRHYVRKTFMLDAEGRMISTRPREDAESPRLVVTTDMIADVIETVHVESGHRGWDATWKDVNSAYYGILREDVIFLLRRCHTCLRDPRKKPKTGNHVEEKATRTDRP
jgi:hypothetical protein